MKKRFSTVLFLIFSIQYFTAATFLVKGGPANTEVDVENLWIRPPNYYKTSQMKDIALPPLYREKFAENFADDLFWTRINNNLEQRKTGFRLVRCRGKYNRLSDNGYDGLYVLLDNNNRIAKFSDCNNIVLGSNQNSKHPIIMLNESKYSTQGRLRFGSGINEASQMSEAWVRYVAHNVLLNNGTYVAMCPSTTLNANQTEFFKDAACTALRNEILNEIIQSNRGLRRVFRFATVLDGSGNFTIYGLYNSKSMLKKTMGLLRVLL